MDGTSPFASCVVITFSNIFWSGLLGYPWDKADDEAKTLQSAISDELTEYLYQKLGGPQTCPHGNPMPESPLESKLLRAPQLSGAPVGSKVAILRITEEGEKLPSMLAFCFAHGIQPGATFLIVKRNEHEVDLQESRAINKGDTPSFSIDMEKAIHIRYEISRNS